MASIVEGFEPRNVWKYFEEITKIPRPSKHEEKILQYLKDFASERNLEMREDSTGNIVVIKPGSNGGEGAPTIVIQSHVTVCKNERKLCYVFVTILLCRITKQYRSEFSRYSQSSENSF